ncbi:MAG: hypothetical protein M3O35_19640 [Acidobacteriota bacterium]|nr:hypothetical protein [Acidobacteriota bacterium]
MKWFRPNRILSSGDYLVRTIRIPAACVALLMFALFSTMAKDKDEGFSGRWVLDKQHSQGTQAPEGLEQKIKQDGSDINIESKFLEPSNGIVPLLYLGIMVSQIKLSADGSEVKSQVGPFAMASKTKVTFGTMETDWSAVVNGDEVQGHWVRTLSQDGKHCTLQIKETSTKGQGGEATLEFVKK